MTKAEEAIDAAFHAVDGDITVWGVPEKRARIVAEFLAALGAAGWVVVPAEPTEAMLQAPFDITPFISLPTTKTDLAICYRAMLAAALAEVGGEGST